MTLRKDKFGIHFVSETTGNVLSQQEVDRIVALKKKTELGRSATPFRGEAKALAFAALREVVNPARAQREIAY